MNNDVDDSCENHAIKTKYNSLLTSSIFKRDGQHLFQKTYRPTQHNIVSVVQEDDNNADDYQDFRQYHGLLAFYN